jgi:hypothetical protein
MEDNSLNSVLSEEPAAQTQEAETQETQVTEVVDTDVPEATGDKEATTPVDKQEDGLEKHRKGLEAAAMAERRKRQELEKEIIQLRQQQANPPAQTTERPQLGQYATQEEYLAAVADFEADRAWKQREERDKSERLQAAEEEHQNNVNRTANEIVKKGQEKYRDFDAVINSGLAPYLNPEMHQALLMSEQGHEVAYWLANNQAEAARVSQLPALQLVRELAFIESKLQAAPAKEKLPLPETLTQARDTRGRFDTTAYSGPTPLDAILAAKGN